MGMFSKHHARLLDAECALDQAERDIMGELRRLRPESKLRPVLEVHLAKVRERLHDIQVQWMELDRAERERVYGSVEDWCRRKPV